MKIVLTVHQFLPDYSAGTEILTLETAKALRRRGHEVEIWTGFPVDPETARQCPFDTYEYQGFKIFRHNHSFVVPGISPLELEHNNRVFAERFDGYLKERRPDIVHFFHLIRLTPSAIDVAVSNGLPTVLTPTDFWMICLAAQLILPDNQLCLGPDAASLNCLRHITQMNFSPLMSKMVNNIPDFLLKTIVKGTMKSWWPQRGFSSSIRALAERHAFMVERLNKVDRVLVPTRFLESIFIKNGMNPAIARYLPYGLNLEHFKGMKARKRGARLQAGYVGTLCEQKGVHVLFEALRHAPGLPMDLKVYGRTDEFPDYVKRLKKIAEGDDRVEFCGTFPNDRIGEIYAGLDVLVVPSIWYENTPLVIYSAHASKTPVIATNLGGMAEVVYHEENGLLFEKGDSKGLSGLLMRVVEEKGLLEKLAANVRPPMPMEDYAVKIEEVYEGLLKERSKGG